MVSDWFGKRHKVTAVQAEVKGDDGKSVFYPVEFERARHFLPCVLPPRRLAASLPCTTAARAKARRVLSVRACVEPPSTATLTCVLRTPRTGLLQLPR